MESLSIEYVTERELYYAFMPFIKNGGLFLKTDKSYDLDTEIEVDITLPDSLESSLIKGKVCWITPIGVQNGTPAGVGISFIDDPENVKSQIEKSLARLLNSPDATHSM